MNVPHTLTSLYPPAIRQRWGDEMAFAVKESGPKSWGDTIVGAARLWLRPRDWPELFAGHTCAVLSCALAAVTAAAALLVRAAEPSKYLTADPARPATSAWLVLVLAGVLMAAPRPQLTLRRVRELCAMGLRELATPACLMVALWAVANSGVASDADGAAQTGFIFYYWLTLGFGAFRLCRLVARVVAVSRAPGRRRMYVALLLLGAGFALAAVQSQLGTTPGVGAVAIGVGLAVLSALVLIAAQNFHAADR